MLKTRKCYFNSIKVRLKLVNQFCSLECLEDFNSIKVRLKLVVATLFLRIRRIFQFHKGTIKTLHPLSLS